MPTDPPHVLHVTESYAGGVATSIQSLVRSLPEYNHSLLYSARTMSPSGLDLFVNVESMVDGAPGRISQVERVLKSVDADIVHAHSSFAGVYARIKPIPAPVVYTPHCFAFERTDIGRFQRYGYKVVERLLGRRTAIVAACSRRESELATSLGVPAVFVPNVPGNPRFTTPSSQSCAPAITFIGRVCRQKGVPYAIDLTRALRSRGVSAPVRWIGGGDSKLTAELEASGILVTGWVSSANLAKELAQTSIYVHTAEWEGFPMTILEVSHVGIPVVAREIDALSGYPDEYLAKDPDDLAKMIEDLLADRDLCSKNNSVWRAALAENVGDVQRARAQQVYRHAMEGR